MNALGRPRVAVSACLLGNPVRHNAGHQRDRFVCDQLAPWVEFVPICPEVEMGLGTPRETLRLVRLEGEVRLVASRSGQDFTDRAREHARTRVEQLRALGICGLILKRDSPSCGLDRVRVYAQNGAVVGRDRGRFAAAVVDAWPDLPVEEDGRLRDPALREHFVERVFALWEWQKFAAEAVRPADLVRFHTAEKLRLLAHDPARAAELGRLVATGHPKAVARYGALYAEALARPATRPRHVNVLQHAAGILRGSLSPAERREVHDALEGYRRGWLPLVAPVRLLRTFARAAGLPWLECQRYWAPYPDQLGLRNSL